MHAPIMLNACLRLMRWSLIASLAWWVFGAQAAMTPGQALQIMRDQGAMVVAGYRADAAQAEHSAGEFSRLYFDVFEAAGIELTLGARDQALMQSIEMGFGRCIQVALERRPEADLQAAWAALESNLKRAEPLLAQEEAQGGWALTGQSALIVLREGLEALLVVSALSAFLRRSGQADRLPWLWGGVGAALLISGVLAWVLTDLIASAGAWRGALQGALVLAAAAMLGQMAAWMYARRSAERWNATLKAQLAGALDGTPWLVAAIAFLAVSREGVETWMFFQALGGAGEGRAGQLGAGIAVGVGLLALAYGAIQRLGRRAPLTLLFTGTAMLLLVVGLMFAGKGALYLQLAGWLPSTPWPQAPAAGWLGLYPTRETWLAQAALLALVLTLWGLGRRQAAR